MKVVLKLSGKNINPNKTTFLKPLVDLWQKGAQLVLIHGGGPQINDFMERMGKKPSFVQGLRVTDQEVMDITEMVLSGLLNKTLVGMLVQHGIAACGISGRDAGLFLAKKHTIEHEGQFIDIGWVGDIIQVNPQLIETLWGNRILPVVSPISGDSDGKSLNVNADWAASQLAIALRAEKLLLFTDVPGVLLDPLNPDSLIRDLSASDIPLLFQKGIVAGGMIPKLQMIQTVLQGGVEEVFIAGGASLELLDQLLEGKSIPGTRVTR
ncbi:MAG: acetylglutamate kinase [Candidatus Atribacteria bacterium]|nr:acetylglutamate kinase [Candidatus Atribacteria bacterium]